MRKPRKPSKAVLDTLAEVDSPTIANIIELFEVRSDVAGYCDDSIQAVYPDLPPTVGYAVTCTLRASYPEKFPEAYDSLSDILKLGETIKGPKIVVFQDLDNPSVAATYGEVMVTCFKAFGYVGVITSGAGRDFEQVADLDFPCWASSMIVSHGYPAMLETNVPVTIGGLRIQTGDLLHADGNGIVQLPLELASGTAELCEPFLQAEEELMDYLNGRKPTVAGFDKARMKFKANVQRLSQRARRYLKAQ